MQKKQAQSQIYEDLLANDVFNYTHDLSEPSDAKEQASADDGDDDKDDKEEKHEEPQEETLILELGSPEEEQIVFILPDVPGAPDAGEILLEEDEDGDIEVEDEQNVEIVSDPFDWQSRGLENFLPWLHNMMNNPPQHTGYDSTGLEKVIAYYEFLDKTIPKAMRMDIRNVIDSRAAEQAREQIFNALQRLYERRDRINTQKYKINKKAWTEGLVKEGQRVPNITGITITVPLFISRCARVCINGMVSGGHDIEELYDSQVKEYDLDKVQQAELSQLLADMGYPMRQDRGFEVGTHVDTTRSDNRDWAANYPG